MEEPLIEAKQLSPYDTQLAIHRQNRRVLVAMEESANPSRELLSQPDIEAHLGGNFAVSTAEIVQILRFDTTGERQQRLRLALSSHAFALEFSDWRNGRTSDDTLVTTFIDLFLPRPSGDALPEWKQWSLARAGCKSSLLKGAMIDALETRQKGAGYVAALSGSFSEHLHLEDQTEIIALYNVYYQDLDLRHLDRILLQLRLRVRWSMALRSLSVSSKLQYTLPVAETRALPDHAATSLSVPTNSLNQSYRLENMKPPDLQYQETGKGPADVALYSLTNADSHAVVFQPQLAHGSAPRFQKTFEPLSTMPFDFTVREWIWPPGSEYSQHS